MTDEKPDAEADDGDDHLDAELVDRDTDAPVADEVDSHEQTQETS